MLQSLEKEIELRKNYLEVFSDEPSTLYFGGGTPTVYSPQELSVLAEKAKAIFNVKEFVEFTVEANPDDLTPQYLEGLVNIGVNRLSIGIQSFNNEHLRWMNRRHTAAQAADSVRRAQQAGLKNITVDLIYGLPQLRSEEWARTLDQALRLDVPHISAYHLTIEPRTVLGKQLEKGLLKPIDEEESEQQFLQLHTTLAQAGYEHYEVSNFARPGMQAVHNSNYWLQQPYIGIGPSAHSFDGKSRQWNVANNRQYMEALQSGATFFEREELTPEMRYNEYLLTGLRTAKGVNIDYIRSNFGERFAKYLLRETQSLLQSGKLIQTSNIFHIPGEHFFLSDSIIGELFY